MKFTSQYDDSSPLVEMTVSKDANLDEAIKAFEGFLRASGYHFDGELQIVFDREEMVQ